MSTSPNATSVGTLPYAVAPISVRAHAIIQDRLLDFMGQIAKTTCVVAKSSLRARKIETNTSTTMTLSITCDHPEQFLQTDVVESAQRSGLAPIYIGYSHPNLHMTLTTTINE